MSPQSNSPRFASESVCCPTGNTTFTKDGPEKSRQPLDRPWIGDNWIRYGIPTRMFLDYFLPPIVCPFFVNFIREHGPFKIFTHACFYDEYRVFNDEVPEAMKLMLFTTILSNLIETIIFSIYRGKLSPRWLPVIIHHLSLISVYIMCALQGQYAFIFQSAIALHHFAYWPLGAFKDWRSNFSLPQKYMLATWVLGGYTFLHIMHLMVWYEAFGPPKAHRLVSPWLACMVCGASAYQFYYDYIVCASIVRGIIKHDKEAMYRKRS